jgi:hypothetical protein
VGETLHRAGDSRHGEEHALPMLMPVDENGRFHPDYGWLAGTATSEATDVRLAPATSGSGAM